MEVASSDCVTSVNSDDLFVFHSFSSCFVCSFSLSLERQNKSKTNDERGFWCDNVSHRGRRIGADPTPIGATVGGFFFLLLLIFLVPHSFNPDNENNPINRRIFTRPAIKICRHLDDDGRVDPDIAIGTSNHSSEPIQWQQNFER